MASFVRIMKAGLPIILLILALTGGAGNAAADDSQIAVNARKFVTTLADRTIQSLTAQGIDKAERRDRFR